MANALIGFMVLILAAMATTVPPIAADVDCSSMFSSLLSCLGYFTAPGSEQPGDACCSATQNIAKHATQSQENLQGLCECFESVAAGSGTFTINMVDKVKAITQLCKLPIDIPVSTTVDCKTLTLPNSPLAPATTPAAATGGPF